MSDIFLRKGKLKSASEFWHINAFHCLLHSQYSVIFVYSSSNCDLVIQRKKQKISERAFSVAASRSLNQLPT